MNKENEEEMLSFDGDIYFERMFSPICFSCKSHGAPAETAGRRKQPWITSRSSAAAVMIL